MELDYTALFIKMVALLLVVIVLGFLVIRFIGPGARLRRMKGYGKDFELLGLYRLDPKKSLYIVRIGKRTLVLGGGEASLNLITELNDGDLDV